MSVDEISVSLGGAAAVVLLAWFFFGPKKARRAVLRGGVQEVEVMVKGGYSPSLIRVQLGVPVRLIFDRQEGSDCTSRVVFPDFRVSKSLPAFQKTAVEFTPDRTGEFGFACGMNMVHGTLVVEEAAPGAAPSDGQAPAKTAAQSGRVSFGVIRFSDQVPLRSPVRPSRHQTIPYTDDTQMAEIVLRANKPVETDSTVAHGDYKLDNVMFAVDSPALLVAIFDWEMATIGDPLADLGWLMHT